MPSYLDFINDVSSFVESFNFDKVMQDLHHHDQYVPETLIDITQKTIYFLEHEKRLSENISNCFGFYLAVLRGEHETKKHFSKLELMYLIHKLDELINKKHSSPNFPKHLYM